MRVWAGVVAALVCGVLAAPASAAPLTATQIRIADHPGFVRVVVDFSGGTVASNELEATDPDPFPERLRPHPAAPSGRQDHGYAGPRRRRLRAHRPERRAAHHSAQRRRPAVQVPVLRHPARAGARDLRPVQEPPAERRRRDHARARRLPDVHRPLGVEDARARGRPRAQPVRAPVPGRAAPPRRPRSSASSTSPPTAGAGTRASPYPHAGRQTGTLEAVDLSDKDGDARLSGAGPRALRAADSPTVSARGRTAAG